MRKIMATLFASALLFGGLAGTASAQVQDGLVNVAIGDITVQDVNVAAITDARLRTGPRIILCSALSAADHHRIIR